MLLLFVTLSLEKPGELPSGVLERATSRQHQSRTFLLLGLEQTVRLSASLLSWLSTLKRTCRTLVALTVVCPVWHVKLSSSASIMVVERVYGIEMVE